MQEAVGRTWLLSFMLCPEKGGLLSSLYVPAGLGNHTLQGCVHEGEEENTAEEESHQDEDPVHLVQQRVLHLQLGKEEGEHR